MNYVAPFEVACLIFFLQINLHGNYDAYVSST